MIIDQCPASFATEIKEKMNVILYDDHTFVMEAIAKHSSKPKTAQIVSQCETIDETLSAIKKHKIDIMIADVLSSENSGTKLFENVLSQHPKVKIIVFSAITNSFVKDCLIEMGVRSVVSKSASLDYLWQIVTKVHHDKASRDINPIIIPRLTDREKNICDCLVEGLSVPDISHKFGTSSNTINNQKKNLLRKFNCKNSTELIVKLAQMNLIEVI